MKKVWFVILLWLTKFLSFICKIFKINTKVVLGTFALKLQKDFIKYFTNIDYNKTIFITGTNGKTITTNIISSIFNNISNNVITNIQGENKIEAIANLLIENSTFLGKIKKEYLIIEVDEIDIKNLYTYIPSKNICITNIQTDYVTKSKEPDYIYNNLKSFINNDVTIYLNNEDPYSKILEDCSEKVIYYSVSKNDNSYNKDNLYDLSMPCPKCNSRIIFNYYNINNIGNFKCNNCDYKSENKADYEITKIDYKTHEFVCNKDKYYMPIDENIYMYIYALVIAVCRNFSLTKKQIETGLNSLNKDKYNIKYKDKDINYIEIRYESAQTFEYAINTLKNDKNKKLLLIGIDPVNYINTFTMYESDISGILNSNIDKCICFSKTMSYDIANRLVYAGFEKDKIVVLSSESYIPLIKEIDKYQEDNIYLLTNLNKYEEIKKYIYNMEKDDNNE